MKNYSKQIAEIKPEVLKTLVEIHNNPSFDSKTLAILPDGFSDEIAGIEFVKDANGNYVFKGVAKNKAEYRAVIVKVTFKAGKTATMFSSSIIDWNLTDDITGFLFTKVSDYVAEAVVPVTA